MRKLTDTQYGEYILNLFRETKPDTTNGLWAVAIWIALLILTISLIAGCDVAWAEPMNLMASWYSEAALKRDGQWAITKGVTASGQLFTDSGLTAASWDYPLGTKVKVTRTDNKAVVVVLVNDRTARRFKGKRIDLSKWAFSRIADCKQGIVPVTVEVIHGI